MIKNYRNALLAAAVASFTVGCGGDGIHKDSPLSDTNNLPSNLASGDRPTLQAIADLIGGVMGDITGNTQMIFDTFDVVSSDTTAVGKLLGSGNADSAVSTPGGINTVVSAKCTGAGPNADKSNQSEDFFELAVLIELEGASNSDGIPDFENGFEDLALGKFDTALDLRFTKCNEPVHDYSKTPAVEDPSTSPRILDGSFSIVLDSKADIPGSNSTKDFQMEGKVEMNNYFIQTDLSEKPDLVSGEATLALITDDVSTENYETVIGLNLTSNDGVNDKYIHTNITASGSISLSKSFDIGGYSLQLGGDLTEGQASDSTSYRIFTVSAITSDGGVNPTAGRFGIIDLSNNFTHYATAENGGLTFDLQEDVEGNRKTPTTFCTWEQIEKDDCKIN